MRPLKIKVSFAYAILTFVNEFVKWSRPLNSIGRLKIGHPGWYFSKRVLELSTTESSFVPEGTNGLKTKEATTRYSLRAFMLHDIKHYTLYIRFVCGR